MFEEDTVRHYQDFLARRPADEYGPVDAEQWSEFEEHFDKRKVELGNCDRLRQPVRARACLYSLPDAADQPLRCCHG